MTNTSELIKDGEQLVSARKVYQWAVGVTDAHITGALKHLNRYHYDYRIGQYEDWFGVPQTMLHFRRQKDALFFRENVADRVRDDGTLY